VSSILKQINGEAFLMNTVLLEIEATVINVSADQLLNQLGILFYNYMIVIRLIGLNNLKEKEIT
jgi:hypothetical protein